MNSQNDMLVSICCITYNHAPYIRQCLDGFLMQKTTFRYEIIIHDDCSTDGTTDIIKEYASKYADLIVPIIQQVNQYQNGNKRILASFVFPKARGKYIALCEGDDYWIDPLKLQKQVAFLNTHPAYGMCFTDFDLLDVVNNKKYFGLFKNQQFPLVYDLKQWIINYYYAAPMTWLIRHELISNIPNIKSTDGTYVYFAYFLFCSKVFCLEDVTAVYRRIAGSASNALSPEKEFIREEGLFNAKIEMIKCFFSKNEQEDLIPIIERKYYRMCLKLFVALGKYEQLNIAEAVLNGGDGLIEKILFLYPRKKFATKFFYVFYKQFKRLRKKLLKII